MTKGTYIGEVLYLRGKTALVMDHPNADMVRVQFDDISLGSLAHGWHNYDRADWHIEEDEDDDETVQGDG